VKIAEGLSRRRIEGDLSSRGTTTTSRFLKELTGIDSTLRPLPIGLRPVE